MSRGIGFSSDSRYVILSAVADVGKERLFVVVSAQDGRVLHRLKGLNAYFTHSGRHLVIETSKELVWRRVTDWQPVGVATKPTSYDGTVTRVFDSWAAIVTTQLSQKAGGQLGESIIRIDGSAAIELGAWIVAADEERALTTGGAIIEITPLRILARPPDRQYHPDARRLSVDGRLLWLVAPDAASIDSRNSTTLIDVAMDKAFSTTAGSVDPQLFRVSRSAAMAQFASYELPYLLPTAEVDIDPGMLRLWACVITCGDLDASGQFVFWDEATWHARRNQLADRAKPIEGFPFPGPIVGDTFYWLRTLANAMPIEEALPIHNRLIAVEPTAEHYIDRAKCRAHLGNHAEALDDWEHVADLCPHQNLPDGWAEPFVSSPDLPRNLYERVDRLFGRQPYILSDSGETDRLFGLYRVGKYKEVLKRIAHRQAARLTPVLNAMGAVGWPPMILNSFLRAVDTRFFRSEYLLAAAMCHHRLGQADLSRVALERYSPTYYHARRGNSQEKNNEALYKEALKLTGYKPATKK